MLDMRKLTLRGSRPDALRFLRESKSQWYRPQITSRRMCENREPASSHMPVLILVQSLFISRVVLTSWALIV